MAHQRKLGLVAITIARIEVCSHSVFTPFVPNYLAKCKHPCCKEMKYQLTVELTCTHRDGVERQHVLALESASDITKKCTASIRGI